jgi:N6-L-threonylcarbamoyladenine synthase
MANLLDKSNINFPFLCLLVSVGHTQVWSINKLDDYVLLGQTRDDAAGEAFDKGARIMGLGYPGGPEIEECAIDGNPKLIKFPRALIKSNKIEFSFSGVKTSLLYFMDSFNESQKYSIADVAASYQQAIIDCLINKIELAIVQTGINIVTIAGGVAKNSVLRNEIKKTFPKNKIIFPDMNYCTDNAAMISFLGEIKFNLGSQSCLDFGIIPNFQLESN